MKTKVLLMLLERIQEIEDRFKRLEQRDTYMPYKDEEPSPYNSQIGGTDDRLYKTKS
jgi:uncharacterized protein YwqG